MSLDCGVSSGSALQPWLVGVQRGLGLGIVEIFHS